MAKEGRFDALYSNLPGVAFGISSCPESVLLTICNTNNGPKTLDLLGPGVGKSRLGKNEKDATQREKQELEGRSPTQ
jgi:hypothetical protein